VGRERGQSLLRVAISTVVAIYLYSAHPELGISDRVPTWLVILGYAGVSIVLFLWVLRSKASNPLRRAIANVADICAITFAMISTGESGMPYFLLYLWVTLGNGFRYGSRALITSAALSVIGFGLVVAFTPDWQTHQALSSSVLLALIILPLYSAHLIAQMNRALEQAREASAAKGQFLARMSHELRTPLNGVLGAADLLEHGKRIAPEDKGLLQVIRDSVEVSLNQINNVLDLSRLEAGKLSIENGPFDLHELVNTTARMVRPAASQKGLRFHVRISPDVRYRLIGDAFQLRAVLLNLLTNAVKFTEQGMVSLDVSVVDTSPRQSTVRFEVYDTGIGISADALERIFESFSQEDAGTTRRFGGTGLGTTIAKQLTELMGGRIGVQSVKGHGSVFWAEIPLEHQIVDVPVPSLPGSRILLITQSEQISRYFSDRFSEVEAVVVRTRSRQEALEAVERSLRLGNAVHAVFIDAALAMEDAESVHGSALYERLASVSVPLIMITDIAPDASRLRQLGYSAVVACRASREQVYSVIHSVRAPFDDNSAGIVNVPPWLWNRKRGERRRLLVADDNRTNLMIVRRILEEAGYEIDTAETGNDALGSLQRGGYRLAILDMHMPGLDGISVLRTYRAQRPRSRLPVIVLTANASLDAQRQCAESGASAYLAKPVRASELLGEIDRLLADSEVESIQPLGPRGSHPVASGSINDQIVDAGVLAELDRIMRDPDELNRAIAEYEREGRELLERIASAVALKSHSDYADAIHAFKGNSANVGATRLIQMCREAESAGIVDFLREREQRLSALKKTFDETLDVLRGMFPTLTGGPRARQPQ